MKDPLFEELTPFEKTMLLELAKTQAFASAVYQTAFAKSPTEIPPAKEHLRKCLDDAILGILATLKKNQ